MSLKICSLSSGSTGNCVYIASDTTKLFIDAGISLKRIEKCLRVLNVSCEDFSILVTHNHKDHILSVPSFAKKYGAHVYAHRNSSSIHKGSGYIFKEFDYEVFTIGDITVSPFYVSHDVPCVGFVITCANKQIFYMTDVGVVDFAHIPTMTSSDIVFIECNHDVTLVKNGRYPEMLKRRILSGQGHLSNDDCAYVCSQIVGGRDRKSVV